MALKLLPTIYDKNFDNLFPVKYKTHRPGNV